MSAILEANPHLHGTVFDLPTVTEGTDAVLAASGIIKRCEAIGGDFFDSIPEGRDVHILKWVLHNWPDDRGVRILENCRRGMPDDGLLVIVERVLPERATTPTPGEMWDLHMLVMLNGLERSELQFRQLLHRSGFDLTRVTPLQSGMSIIEASPA